MTSGQTIRKLRLTLGLTQIEFSKKLKVEQATISAWETDTRLPSPHLVGKLVKIAKKNDINIAYEDIRQD